VLNEIEPGGSKTKPRTLELSNRRCQTRNRTPNSVRRERIQIAKIPFMQHGLPVLHQREI